MPFAFDPPATEGALRQGEILGDVWLHQPLAPATSIDAAASVEIRRIPHRLVAVLHSDCDLLHDFNERERARAANGSPDENHPSLILQVLLCNAYEESEVKSRSGGSDIWKRIRQNQDERYHRFDAAPITNPPDAALPLLILDFRKTFAVFTESLYAGLSSGAVKRIAVIPPVYLHDLMHRFFGYLSRVALPD